MSKRSTKPKIDLASIHARLVPDGAVLRWEGDTDYAGVRHENIAWFMSRVDYLPFEVEWIARTPDGYGWLVKRKAGGSDAI